MSGLRFFLLLFFINIPLFAVDEIISQYYKNGMEAYKKGQYDLVIQEFESILSNNWDSPELYYNLEKSGLVFKPLSKLNKFN